ncbi:DUF1304 domain-containing protein [uncultured Tenacibaculum sp.]|uniref:DUF1304 domain-containing protein n=1 Tax=uncultured Tenacibaculum sp. TaxID=174713 RepID=UPI0026200862|nr:DUF1304 domain-containing protein [uncultured Tenacibaculum sp.]
MTYFQLFFIALVALIHIYIVILEMVLWTKPKGIKTFGLKSKEFAEETKVLAANQGLYNGFLAAGLIWSLLSEKTDVALFFLCCVFIAGVYGAYSTKKPRIFFVQSIPSLIGILLLLL